MGNRGRAGMMFLAVLLLAGVASADPPGMVAVPAPSPPPLPALQPAPAAQVVVASSERASRFSLNVSSRGVCFDFVEQFGCTGGEQFGFGMKYGDVHAGILFGGGELHGDYLVLRPYVGGEVGTRYYTLSRRRRSTFSIAGRASFDLLVGVALTADSGTTIGLLNTVGPNLRWDFDKRLGVFFRGGIGYFAGGTAYSTYNDGPTSGITYAVEMQLGVLIKL